MIINSPLRVAKGKNPEKAKLPKQFFILNLNNYRNAYYQTLNNTKKNYKTAIANQLKAVPVYTGPIKIHYRLFPQTKRLSDIGNVIAVHKKYFEDALVEAGKIPDDNYNHVVSSSEDFGEVDKENPRVEITIKQIN